MASAEYRVLTPERVNLEYDIAGIGSRGAAVIVDTAIQALALLVVLVALTAVEAAVGLLPGRARPGGTILEVLGVALFILAMFTIANGYFMLFEIVWSGQTPGKRLVGVRVLRENGFPPRPIDAVIRNLVRIVDWLPFLYGVGVLSMLLNRRARRLGDFAGGTVVVRESRLSASTATFGYPLSSANLAASALESAGGYVLAAGDATLVRDFLLRRAGLDPTARRALAERLARVLCQRYRLPTEPDPEAQLERLAG